MKVAVIGSGPTGVACAKGLIGRGVAVTVIDAGETLDAGRLDLIARLREMPVADWPAEDVARIKENPSFAGRGIPRRRWFGSDFVFAGNRPEAPLATEGTTMSATFAKGGFSTVWGASMLPMATSDMGDWPFDADALHPYYRKALADLPLSAEPGNHDRDFPTFHAGPVPLPLPGQCADLLARMQGQEAKLIAQGVRFGRARLAVQASPVSATGTPASGSGGCNSCGLCLYGCVPGAIHSTTSDIDRLVRQGQIAYAPGRMVDRLTETTSGVTVGWRGTRPSASGMADFDAVFLAAGALNTTRLLMRHLSIIEEDVHMLDSQKCMVPLVNMAATASALSERRPILPGLFLDMRNEALGPYWVHSQIYAVSEPMLARLGMDDAKRHAVRRGLAAPVLKRLMLSWLSLHSTHSDGLVARLDRTGETLTLRAAQRKETRRHIARAARRLARIALGFGTLYAWPAMQVGVPGSGHHVGGSFPMRREPRHRCETDVWGRPAGRRRIFAVDTSVMPSIPATTITLPAMANAWRIGAAAPLGD